MLRPLYKLSDWLRHRARRRHWTAEQAAGRRAEDLAQRYLQRQGLVIVARNYRLLSGAGEIDIVAREGSTVVFIEVKSRTSEDYGSPERAISAEKRANLLRTAVDYLRRHRLDPRQARFDVVTVVFGNTPRIRRMGDVFSLREGL